jgi:imidazolonepropionase-like amidohydrolase
MLFALGLLCSLVTAQDRSTAATSPNVANNFICIIHVTVIDTESGHEDQDRTVTISGERISEVRESRNAQPPVGAKVVDGTGKYLIPGLWDMHAHNVDVESTYPLYFANGVTGVREMFGPPDANIFRVQLAAKQIDSPHMYIGSPVIDGSPAQWSDSIVVNTPEEARRAVDEQKRKGADFVKVYNRLSRDAYFAIIDEAKRQQISVEGHVPFAVSAWEATESGQKSFEHLFGIPDACSRHERKLRSRVAAAKTPIERDRLYVQASKSYSEEKCRSLFAAFKKNHTWQVPTLVVNRSVGRLNDPQFTNDYRLRYFDEKWQGWLSAKERPPYMKNWTASDFKTQRDLFAYDEKLVGAMFRAGVPLLAGTDVSNPYCFPGFSMHDELALLVESGVSPLGALQAATRNAALFMDASDKYGSVTPGKIADLVLLGADPLKDIGNTKDIVEVFLAGTEFDHTALDQMLRNAEATARAHTFK